MIRIGKLTDYGIVLLTHFARDPGLSWTARDLAKESDIPLPTVSKLLKVLANGDILSSQRGVRGGYSLVSHPQQVSIAAVITVLEGPIALTECNTHSVATCELEQGCPVKTNWRRINDAVTRALDGLTLADMSLPLKRNEAKHGSYQEPLLTLVKRKTA